MISINIPVYNYCVSGLVSQLIYQGEIIGIDFEIRVYDDGSDFNFKKENRNLKDYRNVIYKELENNIGRSAIRNKMGFESKYANLLFIDADSTLVNENYLLDFIRNIKPNRILCGGTAYNDRKPAQPEKYLRWFYGLNREAIRAEVRNNKKGFIITSNNFLIEKEIFKRIHFREEIKKYGHEDTLLGYDLYKNGVEIYHIDNPVEHTGLEDSKLFLEKTRLALKSLFAITHDLIPGEKEFAEQVHFLNQYSKIRKFLPLAFQRLFYRIYSRRMERNLIGSHPSLFLFDLYKLCYYSTLK